MMKAPPTPAFVVAKADFLLEFLVIALDPPAPFGICDKLVQRCVGGKRGEPVFGRCVLVLGPLHHEPLLGSRFAAFHVAVGRSDPNGGEASAERRTAAFAPGHCLPGLLRQRLRERLGRDGLVLGRVPHARGGATNSPRGLMGSGCLPGGQRLVEDWMPTT